MNISKNDGQVSRNGKNVVLGIILLGLAVTGSVWAGFLRASSSLPTPPQGQKQETEEIKKLIGTLRREEWADWKIPHAAAQKLAELGRPAVRPLFDGMLGSNEIRLVYWMEFALYRMAETYQGKKTDPRYPLPEFTAILDNERESYDVRRLAARMMGKLGDAAGVPSLKKNSSDPRVALDVTQSLGWIPSDSARDALAALLATAEGEQRLEAVRALGRLGDAAALVALEPHAGSGDAELRSAVVEAIGKIRGRGSLDVLRRVAAKENDPRVKRALSLGFLRLGESLPSGLELGAESDIKEISCRECHAQLYTDFLVSAHNRQVKLNCVTCHGESVRHQDSYGIQPADRTYAGEAVAALCAQCHDRRDLSALERTLSGRLRHTFSYRGNGKQRASEERSVAGETLSYAEDFENGAALGWEPVNPTDWRVEREDSNRFYSLFNSFTHGVPRRPIQFSLLKGKIFTDFTLTCRVRRPNPKSTALILVFGYQDETHYYYAHFDMDKNPDMWPHNGLFVVDGEPRRRIGTPKGVPLLPDTEWHTVKIVRRADTGSIALYMDDATKPVMEAVDHRYRWGRIGVGSFHGLGHFDDIQVTVGTTPDPE